MFFLHRMRQKHIFFDFKKQFLIINNLQNYTAFATLQEDFNSWLTKSISSQSKLFGSQEGKPKNQLVPAEPRKEKWRYRNVRTILRRLSALTIDKRWHQVKQINNRISPKGSNSNTPTFFLILKLR